MIIRYLENRLTYQAYVASLRSTPTPWLPRPRRIRKQLRPAQAHHTQRLYRRTPWPTQALLHCILKMHPDSYLLCTRPRERQFRAPRTLCMATIDLLSTLAQIEDDGCAAIKELTQTQMYEGSPQV